MNKLISYLKQGKGKGIKAIFIFSALIGISLWGIIYATAKKIPESTALNDFINQLPTIVIQDGIVVEPAHTDTTYSIKGYPLLHVQTDREEVSPFSEDGVYLTRKMFALVLDKQIQQAAFLSGNITITPDTIKKTIHTLIVWTPILVGISYFITLWLFYLLVVGVAALITSISRIHLNKGTIWRSASFSVISIVSIDVLTNLILGFFGRVLHFGLQFQFMCCVLLVLLIAFGIREQTHKRA